MENTHPADATMELNHEEGLGLLEVDGITLDPLRDFVPRQASGCQPIEMRFRSSMAEHIFTKNAQAMQQALYSLEMVIPRYMVEREYIVACENMVDELMADLRKKAEEDRAYFLEIIRNEGRQPASVVHESVHKTVTFSGGFTLWCEVMRIVDELLNLADALAIERRIRPSKRMDTFNRWRNLTNATARKLRMQARDGFRKMGEKLEERRKNPNRDTSNERNRLILAKREAAKYRKQKKRAARQAAQADLPEAEESVRLVPAPVTPTGTEAAAVSSKASPDATLNDTAYMPEKEPLAVAAP